MGVDDGRSVEGMEGPGGSSPGGVRPVEIADQLQAIAGHPEAPGIEVAAKVGVELGDEVGVESRGQVLDHGPDARQRRW